MTRCFLMFTFLTTICFMNIFGQTDSQKAGPEYDVLDAWSGTWNIQVEARDSISGPFYHVNWTLKGERILNGYALEIVHKWQTKDFTLNGIEVTGYNPSKKSCMTYIFHDNGNWLNSAPIFVDKRTCIENGATYFPNGEVGFWRCTWNFSDDWMSLVVICEYLTDNIWWKAYEGKGTKNNKK